MDEFCKSLGLMFSESRNKLGFDQSYVSFKAKLYQSELSMIERGKKYFAVHKYKLLCELFEIDLNEVRKAIENSKKLKVANKADNSKIFSHDVLQQQCWEYLWNEYPESRRKCWHTANEVKPYHGESRFYHMQRINKAKSIGMLPGVTDLVFYFKGILYIFDVKIGKDVLSDAQRSFIDAICSEGGQFFEINNLADFKAYIDEIMKSHGIEPRRTANQV